MKHLTMLTALGLGLMMASPIAMGQMAKRKRGHGPTAVRGFMPKAAAPGTTVTITGRGFKPMTMVQLGKRKIKPAAVTAVSISFVVPKLKPGRHLLAVTMGPKSMPAGMLMVTPETAAAAPPAVGGPRKPMVRGRGRHRARAARWKALHAKPAVYSFAPRMGKPGQQVVIRGRNFAPGAKVFFNNKPVAGARVAATRIVFTVPPSKRDGLISIRQAGQPGAIIVGMFDLKGRFDRAAEARRQAAMKKAAQDAWLARQRALAKSREARLAAYNARMQELAAQREARRAKRLAAWRAQWEMKFLNDPQVRAELALHAERAARLRHMLRLAEIDNSKLAVRIQLALNREDERHKQRMVVLKTAFAANTGGPQ